MIEIVKFENECDKVQLKPDFFNFSIAQIYKILVVVQACLIHTVFLGIGKIRICFGQSVKANCDFPLTTFKKKFRMNFKIYIEFKI